ncbi:unnamed protein product [Cyclocybe aegerita]|uniref:SET domain-containing protein n=1 Tax=Cyclocybe aegerita TaxID=1973307 RepID=A0A8S0VQ86_CYCAE|nr:unnamed protein product [Cyclocybe aegerita]
MAPASSTSRVSSTAAAPLTWRPTKIMHMRDLAKDDDFLSHLLVEKVGTGAVPLLVHKMDATRRLPRTDTQDIMRIVRRLVLSKAPIQQTVRQAVDDLLLLPSIRYFLKSYTQKQINAFATHASRYFELYNPSGSIEIAHTSRYSHQTGKSELCILATRPLAPGSIVTELKGSMANLTEEEDKELKRTDLRKSDIRRDFSVIHSKSMKKNHLFLGPARFVNHDCDNNCELLREGRYITFRVLRPIAIGEEITAHYGDGYFGKKNRDCLCETCEKNGRGGYAPDRDDPESSDSSSSDPESDSDSDSDSSSSESEEEVKPLLNVNERRTRRGVYAVTKPQEDDSDDSDNDEEDDDKIPLAEATDIPADGEIKLTVEIDAGSDLTSLAPSTAPSDGVSPAKLSTPGPMTPNRGLGLSRSSSSLTDLTPSVAGSATPHSTQSTPFRSIIATRRQKAKELEEAESASRAGSSRIKSASRSASVERSPRRLTRVTRSVSSLRLSEKKGKGKATPTPIPTPLSDKPSKRSKSLGKDEPRVKKEELDSRLLRVRPSVGVPEASKEPPRKPEVPRGPDGKPLPTCTTCSNVLPLISVDSKVVWGLGLEANGKKKKHVKQECPRCIRHFAIYECPWPSRSAPHGTISVTPREDSVPADSLTKKVTQKGLSLLDRKLAAAAASASKPSKSKKHRRDEEEEVEEARPLKRRKSEPELVLPKGRVTKTYSRSARRYRRSPTPELPRRRGPGRPRLASPLFKHKITKVKVEEPAPEVEKSTLSQPRAQNGRFGKKDKKKTQEATSARSQSDGSISDGQESSPARKRHSDDVEVGDDSPRKKVARRDEGVASQKVLPRRSSGFSGSRLFSNPSPLQFALKAWAGPVILDDSSSSSSSSDEQPETPEDDQSPAADVVEPEELSTHHFLPGMMPRGPLTYKPSPLSFAKNRWNAVIQVGKTELDVKQPIPRKSSYNSDGENSEIGLDREITHSPPPDDDYPSVDDYFHHGLRQVYPILPADNVFTRSIPKTTSFRSADPQTKPSFINAGWDDSSDASEA